MSAAASGMEANAISNFESVISICNFEFGIWNLESGIPD
jgi:hypothetical protein